MIGVRLVVSSDRWKVHALAKAAAAESEAELGFDRDVFDRTFDAIVTKGHPTGFVAVDGEDIIGFALAQIDGFFFTSGVCTILKVVYVTPVKRGTRAAAILVSAFVEWSVELGVRRMYLGINNSLHPDRTARFFERFGARRVGYEMVI